MRIVIEARESGTSTGRHIDKLVEYLYKAQPSHEIIILTKQARVSFIKDLAPRFEIRESNYKEFTFSEQFGLASQLYSLHADLVHFTMTQQPILYFGRSVTTIHDLTTARFRNPAKNYFIFKFKQLIYRAVIWWAAHKSKRILTISEYVKRDLARFARINLEKITTTYLAADKITDSPEPIEDIKPDSFIMYVGRPQPHKNLKNLVLAFDRLKAEHPDLQLVLAGKKDVLYEAHEKWITEQGINGIIFTGFVSEGQLRWLYENTAAYVFPSLSEGFGLPGLEAMIHGAPVVSSSATCLPEIYGEAAHYFDPRDVDDIAAKIAEVLDDEQLRTDLIKKGKAQAAKYSWERMAKQTLEVYNKALDA